MYSATLDWALTYLELGYAPVPIIRGGRATAVPWGEWQNKCPTESDVRAWFGPETEGKRNVGLLCGGFHGLVLVDCDDEAAVRFARLQFGPTPYRQLSRRGLHLLYRHPGGCHIKTAARVIPGYNLDIRGDGGLATGLGSVHPSGFVYHLDEGAELVSRLDLPVFDPTWLPASKPLGPPPLARELDAVRRAEAYLSRIQGAGRGGRNQHTFSVAAAVVRDFGLTLEQGWALMSTWNQSVNDPPLDDLEVKRIVESCLKAGRRPFGAKLREERPWRTER